MSVLQKLLLVSTLIMLSGCASRINFPDPEYWKIEDQPNIVRAAFDMDGHIYPRDSDTVKNVRWNVKGANVATSNFGLSRVYRLHRQNGEHYPFNEAFIGQLYQEVADKISQKITEHNATQLIVVSHGFKTSYNDAITQVYPAFYQQFSADTLQKSVILELSWDGRYLSSWASALSLYKVWPVSLTYSNLAGQIGLRNILNRIDNKGNIDLVLLSHSRGAGVVLSSLMEPEWDKTDDLCVPQMLYSYNDDDNLEYKAPALYEDQLCASYFVKENTQPLSSSYRYKLHFKPQIHQYKSVNVGLIAPAVGNGHFNSALYEFFQDSKLKLVYSQQPDDFALNKVVISGERFGPSDFGVDDMAYQSILSQPSIQACAIDFTTGKKHSVDDYFEDQEATSVFFQTLGLQTPDTPLSELEDKYCL